MSPRRYPPVRERIAARTVQQGDCLVYTAGSPGRSGHRTISRDGRTVPVHRVAWELANGRTVPPGMCVCHSCDNPPCVNPAHLWIGTVADNNRDRDQKGRGVMPPPELIGRLKSGPIRHGSIYAYVKRKCRCGECREAIRVYRNRNKALAA